MRKRPRVVRTGDLATAPIMTRMDFLNEVSQRYPDAISLAAGRPDVDDVEVADIGRFLTTWERHLLERGHAVHRVRDALVQYGAARGMINEIVSRNLKLDHGVVADPAHVVVTVGAQEALYLTLQTLRRSDADVVLTVGPTYVGLLGAARVAGIGCVQLDPDVLAGRWEALPQLVSALRDSGRDPRALYVVPDFANPSGDQMDLSSRHALVEAAEEAGVLVLEDNPYGLLDPCDDAAPTLKSLDPHGVVIFIVSYAKTLLPGVRIGALVAEQPCVAPDGTIGVLADQVASLKSMVTLNTPPVAQAVAAGALLEAGCTLRPALAERRERYTTRRDAMVGALHRELGDLPITWNEPAGGFFLVVSVPFVADDEALARSAARGVLWTPMHHFYTGSTGERALRLSFSQHDECQIIEGVIRLADFARTEMAEQR